jgi:hypothetical protein
MTLILPSYSTRCRLRTFHHTYWSTPNLCTAFSVGLRPGAEMSDGTGVYEGVSSKNAKCSGLYFRALLTEDSSKLELARA